MSLQTNPKQIVITTWKRQIWPEGQGRVEVTALRVALVVIVAEHPSP